MQLYRLDQAPPNKEEQAVVESGLNRKGYFVREKRKKGKKGVKNYDNSSPNNRNRNNSSGSDSNSKSESESENDDEEGNNSENSDNYKLYIVQKRIEQPEMIRSGPFYGCTCTRTCHCGKELGTRRRRDVVREIDDL